MLRFGPPRSFTYASTCPWLGHPVSGLFTSTKFALFRLAFTTHPSNDLCLHYQITRWIVLQKARRHQINWLRLLVRTQFQVLFHSHSWVLFAFPSRYLFTIDRKIYLALEGGPPSFSQDCTCPDLLYKTNIRLAILGILGFHYLWLSFPTDSARIANFLPYARRW